MAGEVFGIAKPDVGDEWMAQLRDMAREVLDEGRAAGDGNQETHTSLVRLEIIKKT